MNTKSKLLKLALLIAWGFFMFVVPVGLILAEFVLATEYGHRLALTGVFVIGVLFLIYKRILIANLINKDTPLAKFVRTMDAMLPLLIFAILTVWFGEWLRQIGGLVGIIWVSMVLGSGVGWLCSLLKNIEVKNG